LILWRVEPSAPKSQRGEDQRLLAVRHAWQRESPLRRRRDGVWSANCPVGVVQGSMELDVSMLGERPGGRHRRSWDISGSWGEQARGGEQVTHISRTAPPAGRRQYLGILTLGKRAWGWDALHPRHSIEASQAGRLQRPPSWEGYGCTEQKRRIPRARHRWIAAAKARHDRPRQCPVTMAEVHWRATEDATGRRWRRPKRLG